MKHKFDIGALVELKNGARMFVVAYDIMDEDICILSLAPDDSPYDWIERRVLESLLTGVTPHKATE